jgi:CheY-like chemotaxis protein
VARIIHIEDETLWINIVSRALADHHVDPARTFDEALALLGGSGKYELALIDWNLGAQGDKSGAEILDLLREDYPETRRVVITAKPPPGNLKSRIYDRYGVDDLIIKDNTSLPDLQLVVRRALKRRPDEVSVEVNKRATAIRESIRDWREGVRDRIRSNTRKIENNPQRTNRTPSRSAEALLDGWRTLHEDLTAECSRLYDLIAEARTIDDVAAVATRFDKAIAGISGDTQHLLRRNHQVDADGFDDRPE